MRALIKLIEVKRRPIVFTDFEDEIGASSEIEIRGVNVGTDMDRFRAKARHFLKDNVNRLAVMKLRRNEPLTPTDLDELERIFVGAGAEPAQMEAIRAEGGLGVFVRSLVGLDREAAKKAFADFLAARKPTADQIEFVNMIVDHLTDRGVMEPGLLYESPFTGHQSPGRRGHLRTAGCSRGHFDHRQCQSASRGLACSSLGARPNEAKLEKLALTEYIYYMY